MAESTEQDDTLTHQERTNSRQESTNDGFDVKNDELDSRILSLVASGENQNRNIKNLTDNMSILVQAVRMRPTWKQTFGVAGALNLLTLFAVGLLFVPVLNNSNDTKKVVEIAVGCLTPGQECYERGQRNTEANRVEVSLRSEYLRNVSELGLAQKRNDQEAVTFRQERMEFFKKKLLERGIDIEKELGN